MLTLFVAPAAFVAPVHPVGRRAAVVMQFGRPPIDEDRIGRSPGLSSNFYDVDRDEFRRPWGGSVTPTRGPYENPEFAQRRIYDQGRFNGRYGGRYGRRGGGTFDNFVNGGRGFDDGFGYYPGPYEDRGYYGYSARNMVVDVAGVIGQFALLFICVLAAPIIPGASSVSALLGFFFVVSGGLLSVSGAVTPAKGDFLQTDGVYALCRHPIYAGLITACVGLGFLASTPSQLLSRITVTGLLCCLLWYRADREELIFEEQYGPRYLEWAANVPRFFRWPGQWGRGGWGGGWGR